MPTLTSPAIAGRQALYLRRGRREHGSRSIIVADGIEYRSLLSFQIFVAGGQKKATALLLDLQEEQPEWMESIESMAQPRNLASCGSVKRSVGGGEEVVVVGGWYGGKHLDTVEIFDVWTGVWRAGKDWVSLSVKLVPTIMVTAFSGPKLPLPIAKAAVAQLSGSSFLLIGGETYVDNKKSNLNTMYLYEDETWTLLPYKLDAFCGEVSAVAITRSRLNQN